MILSVKLIMYYFNQMKVCSANPAKSIYCAFSQKRIVTITEFSYPVAVKKSRHEKSNGVA